MRSDLQPARLARVVFGWFSGRELARLRWVIQKPLQLLAEVGAVGGIDEVGRGKGFDDALVSAEDVAHAAAREAVSDISDTGS